MLGSLRYAALLFVAVAAVMLAPTKSALAVATVQVQVTGQALNEVTLQITDAQGQAVKEDDDSDRAAGLWWFRNKRPGTYTIQVLRNGRPVGAPQRVTVEDNKTNIFRASGGTGAVSMASAMAPYMTPRYSIGLFGGFSRTPFDGMISSTAGGFADTGNLDDTIGTFGVEGRYYLSPTQQRSQALGTGLFLTGMWLYYASDGLDRYFGNRHPGAANDVGAGIDPRWSFLLGVGKEYNVMQQVGLALMLGAHLTRTDVTAQFDETGGGGPLVRTTKTRTMIGPWLGAELAFGLAALTSLPVQLVLQTRAMWMPDSDVNTQSSFTNWDYRADVDGGIQVQGLLGLRGRF